MTGTELNIDDFISGQTTNIEKLNSELGITVDLMKQLVKISSKTAAEIKKYSKVQKTTGEELKKVNASAKKQWETMTQLEAVHKEEKRLINAIRLEEAKRDDVVMQLNRRLEQERIITKKANDQMKRTVKINSEAVGSYNRLQAELTDNIAKFKQLTDAERKNVAVGGKLIASIRKQQAALKGMDAQLGNHQRNVGNYRSALGGVGGQLKSLATGYVGLMGIQKLGRFIGDSVTAFDKQQQSIIKVRQAIKTTGGAANLSSKQLQTMASDLQQITTFGDEDILNGVTSQLLTFTNVAGDEFKDAQKIILDMSTLLGTDLTSQSIMVGKALNDPIKGLTALTRVGVAFTEEQKAMITQMQKTGDLAGAQRVILAELNKEFGGQAEAARDAIGGVKQLSNTWGDTKEVLGGLIVSALESTNAVESVNEALSGFNTLMSSTATRAEKASGGIDLLKGSFELLGKNQREAFESLQDYYKQIVELEQKQEEEKSLLVAAAKEIIELDKETGKLTNRKEVQAKVLDQLNKMGRDEIIINSKKVKLDKEGIANLSVYITNLATQAKKRAELNKISFKDNEAKEDDIALLKKRNEELMRNVSGMKTLEEQSKATRMEAEALALAYKEVVGETKDCVTELDNVSMKTQQMAEGTEMSLFEQLTGVTDAEEFKTALNDTLSAGINFIQTLASERTKAAEEEISQRESNIGSLEKEIEKSEENNRKRVEEGRATSNRVINQKKKELAEEKKALAEAEKERKKAARNEQLIQIGQATANTALGVTKALGTLPYPLSFIVSALIAAQGLFQIATIKRQKFRTGGQWVEKGKLHSEGGNVYGDKEFERGEQVTVLSRENTKKYGGFMSSIERSIRKGTLEKDLSGSTFINNMDNSRLEKEMKGLRSDFNKLSKALNSQPIHKDDKKTVYKDKVIYHS